MLRIDLIRIHRMNGVHTRDLQNAVVQHHQNNPQSSMETAFEYIMLNSATFRALPDACIEKARKYLALPETVDKSKQMSDKDTYTELNKALQDLSDNNLPLFLMPFRQVITVKERTPTQWNSDTSPADDLKEMFKEPIKQDTTVVHAERVVVDDKKMIRILNVTGLHKGRDLPNEYIMGAPSFVDSIMPNTDVFIHPTNRFQDNCNVSYGDIMSLKDFGQMIKTMKEAAARLSKINKTAKLEREHSGKFTVSICPAKTNSSGCLQVTSGMLHIVQFSKNVSTSNILENTKETHII